MAEFEVDDLDDFDDLDSFGDLESPDETTDDRKPVTKVVAGAKNGALAALTNPATARKFVDKALPTEYGQAVSKAEDVVGKAKSLYDEAIKEAKPGLEVLEDIADSNMKTVRKFLPKKFADKLEERIKKRKESKELNRGMEEVDVVQKNLDDVFGSSAAADTQVVQDAEKNEMDAQVESAKMKVQLASDTQQHALGQSSNTFLKRLVDYQDDILAKYQRKMLELKYRHYFVAKDHFELYRESTQNQASALEAIAKNTALPEFVKIQTNEAMQEMARDRILGGVTDRLSNFAGNAMEVTRRRASEWIKEKAGDFNEALESYKEIQEVQQEAGMDSKEMAGEMIAGGGIDALINLIAPKFKDKLEAVEFIQRGAYKLQHYNRLPEIMNDWARSETEGEGPAAFIIDSLKEIVATSQRVQASSHNFLSETPEEHELNRKRLVEQTIIEVIPDHLSAIRQELAMARTDEEVDRVTYSVIREGMVSESTAMDDIRSRILPKDAIRNSSLNADKILKENGLYDELTSEERNIFKRRIFADAMDGGSFNLDRYTTAEGLGDDTEVGKSLAEKLSAILKDEESGKFKSSLESDKLRGGINEIMKEMTKSEFDTGMLMNQLKDLGRGDLLKRLGYLGFDYESNSNQFVDHNVIGDIVDRFDIYSNDEEFKKYEEQLEEEEKKRKKRKVEDSILERARKTKESSEQSYGSKDALDSIREMEEDLRKRSGFSGPDKIRVTMGDPDGETENIFTTNTKTVAQSIKDELRPADSIKITAETFYGMSTEELPWARENTLYAIYELLYDRWYGGEPDPTDPGGGPGGGGPGGSDPQGPPPDFDRSFGGGVIEGDNIIPVDPWGDPIGRIKENIGALGASNDSNWGDNVASFKPGYNDGTQLSTMVALAYSRNDILTEINSGLGIFSSGDFIREMKGTFADLKTSLTSSDAFVKLSESIDGMRTDFRTSWDSFSANEMYQNMLESMNSMRSEISAGWTGMSLAVPPEWMENMQNLEGFKLPNGLVIQKPYLIDRVKGWFGERKEGFQQTWQTTKDYAAAGVGRVTGGVSDFVRWGDNTLRGFDYKDIYISGMKEPIMTAADLRKGYYINPETQKPIKYPEDIDGPIQDIRTKDFVVTTEMFDRNKFYVLEEDGSITRLALDKASSMVGGLYDTITNVSGMAGSVFAGIKNYLLEDISIESNDVYVEGDKSPRLLARLLRRGEYFDMVTKKPIFNIDDIGENPIVDKDGNVVISEEELQERKIYTLHGKMRSRLAVATDFVVNKAAGLVDNVNDMAGAISDRVASWFKPLVDENGNRIATGSIFGDMFSGGNKNRDVLLDIRDMMNEAWLDGKFNYRMEGDFNYDYFTGENIKKMYSKLDDWTRSDEEDADNSIKGRMARVKDRLKGSLDNIRGKNDDPELDDGTWRGKLNQMKNRLTNSFTVIKGEQDAELEAKREESEESNPLMDRLQDAFNVARGKGDVEEVEETDNTVKDMLGRLRKRVTSTYDTLMDRSVEAESEVETTDKFARDSEIESELFEGLKNDSERQPTKESFISKLNPFSKREDPSKEESDETPLSLKDRAMGYGSKIKDKITNRFKKTETEAVFDGEDSWVSKVANKQPAANDDHVEDERDDKVVELESRRKRAVDEDGDISLGGVGAASTAIGGFGTLMDRIKGFVGWKKDQKEGDNTSTEDLESEQQTAGTHDADGDGSRDGSWQAQRAEEEAEANKTRMERLISALEGLTGGGSDKKDDSGGLFDTLMEWGGYLFSGLKTIFGWVMSGLAAFGLKKLFGGGADAADAIMDGAGDLDIDGPDRRKRGGRTPDVDAPDSPDRKKPKGKKPSKSGGKLKGKVGKVVQGVKDLAGRGIDMVRGGAKASTPSSSTVARGARVAGNAGRVASVASKAATLGRVASVAARAVPAVVAGGGTLLSGVASAATTATTAAAGVISAPVVLGGMAAAGLGYLAYRLFRDEYEMSDYGQGRLMQYGLDPEDRDMRKSTQWLENELNPHINIGESDANIKDSAPSVEELMDGMGLDADDPEELANFTSWFNNRFKPVYLGHHFAKSKLGLSGDLKAAEEYSPEDKAAMIGATRFNSMSPIWRHGTDYNGDRVIHSSESVFQQTEATIQRLKEANPERANAIEMAKDRSKRMEEEKTSAETQKAKAVSEDRENTKKTALAKGAAKATAATAATDATVSLVNSGLESGVESDEVNTKSADLSEAELQRVKREKIAEAKADEARKDLKAKANTTSMRDMEELTRQSLRVQTEQRDLLREIKDILYVPPEEEKEASKDQGELAERIRNSILYGEDAPITKINMS